MKLFINPNNTKTVVKLDSLAEQGWLMRALSFTDTSESFIRDGEKIMFTGTDTKDMLCLADSSFPAGYTAVIKRRAIAEGFEVEVFDGRKAQKAKLAPVLGRDACDWLYDFQHEAVERLLKRTRGILSLPTGCHRLGQGILMFDGSVKKVEDVVVGDQLMGPDSTPRNVLQLCRGQQQMVELTSNKGGPWVVNLDHKLVLVRRDRGRRDGEVIEVAAGDWLDWTDSKKKKWRMFRTAVDFPAGEPLPMDPYVVGVLLGDGCLSSGNACVCSPDKPVLEAFAAEAAKYDARMRYEHKRGATYAFAVDCPGFRAKLRELGLMGSKAGTKVIPEAYLRASREDRLALLAGLLDTDGSYHRSNNCFDFISKSRALSEAIVSLAFSLGIHASLKECQKSCQTGFTGTYWRVGLSGDLNLIPTRVERKQATPRKRKASVLEFLFQGRALDGEEDYYGVTVDGENRYLLDDYIVTRNSGKCAQRATPLLKYDGTVIRADQVVVGDLLMGPDSAPRRVLSTTGIMRGPMRQITPNRGTPWQCNDVHVLCLKHTSTGEVVDMPLDEYSRQGAGWRHTHKQWGATVEFPARELGLDPYLVGLYVGAGRRAWSEVVIRKPTLDVAAAMTGSLEGGVMDPHGRIVDMSPEDEDSPIRQLASELFATFAHRATDPEEYTGGIPFAYRTTPLAQRGQLLAGLIDSCGRRDRTWVMLRLRSERASKDVVHMCQTMGYRAKTTQRGAVFEVKVYGDLSNIPVRTKGKKPAKPKSARNPTMTAFSVEDIGEGEYCGFTLDGDGRFLLGDCTVTHNTEVACGLMLRTPNVRWLVIAPEADLMLNAADRWEKRQDTKCGRLGDGKATNLDSRIVSATMQTLSMRLQARESRVKTKVFLQQFTGVIFDECFAAGTMVSMADGTEKPIEEVGVGDMVLSYDQARGEFTHRVVTKTFDRVAPTIDVTVNGVTTSTTATHPYLTPFGWVPAGGLEGHDVITRKPVSREGCVLGTELRQGCGATRQEGGAPCAEARVLLADMSSGPAEDIRGVPLRAVWDGVRAGGESTAEQGEEQGDVLRGCLPVRCSWRVHSTADGPARAESNANAPRQPDAATGNAREGVIDAEGDRAQATTRWEWPGTNAAAASAVRCSCAFGGGARDGACCGGTTACKGGAQPAAQCSGRCGAGRDQGSDRGGRWVARVTPCAGRGRTEDGIPGVSRVDRVAVQKCGGTRGPGQVRTQRVFNFAVEGTETYVANGVVVHNCHQAPSDGAWLVLDNMNNAFYRCGLSGTALARGDSRNMYTMASFGETICKVEARTLMDLKFIAEPTIYMIPTVIPAVRGKGFNSQYKQGITANKKRNRVIANVAERAAKPCLIRVKHKTHGDALLKLLKEKGQSVAFVHGGHKTEQRQRAIQDVREGNLDIVIASKVWQTGTDIPELLSVIMAQGGKSAIETIQSVGRGLRVVRDSDGNIIKDKVDIYDFSDFDGKVLNPKTNRMNASNSKVFPKHARARKSHYIHNGYSVIELEPEDCLRFGVNPNDL